MYGISVVLSRLNSTYSMHEIRGEHLPSVIHGYDDPIDK